MMLQLEAKTKNEQLLLDYLNQNASAALIEKINTGKKTLAQCWSYIVSEASKLKNGNCAVIDDTTVFGWAIHFFEEDSIEAKEHYATSGVSTKTSKTDKPKPKEDKKPSKAKPEPPQSEQLSLFDM